MSLEKAFASYEAGDRATARAAAEAELARAANNADALHLLAVIAQDESRQSEAEDFARRALEIGPGQPLYLNTLGNGLVAQGRTNEAITVLGEAARAAPSQPDIMFNLANAERTAGRYEGAAESYRKVIALRPGHIGAYNNLALMLKALGDAESAATVLIEATARAPASFEIRFNLGNALHTAGRLDAAEGAFRKAIELAPRHVEAHVNLGVVLKEGGRPDEAEKCFRAAIALNPHMSQAYVGLADLTDDGTMDAVAHRRVVLALKPDLAAVRSSLLMCMQYAPGISRAEIAAEHRKFGEIHKSPPKPAFAPDHDFSPERRLRIGVVSGDFRFHAMAFFALPVFKARARDEFELVCYSTGAKVDRHTLNFRATADLWRDVRALSAEALAELIVRDKVDILIDLAGHAPHNRLLAFALKPAPLQVAWGDYVDTRGLPAIDVLFGDPIQTPPEDDKFYVERVNRFAPDYICYAPPDYAPPVAPPPALRNNGITFGCFSEATKIGPASVAQWAAVLRAVPDARFLFNGYLWADAGRQGKIISLFMDNGIGTDRIKFQTGGDHAVFLGQYAEVDIILDTTPYSGGLTTCESLLMGVPVLTVPGDRFCGRHAAAHLINGGYPDGVAKDANDLIAKAKALAADPAALAPLRTSIRKAFLASRVCDVNGFAKDFYGALRTEWRKRAAE
ncbi:MAG: tetratricopeptide repeat protein [Proteobacteria bacterium]|nr:tetratricopeptide repeat protein [Pseudomonadota bacterium]